MAKFALIIAIENYPTASGLASALPGTNDGAAAFSQWLEDKQKIVRNGNAGYDPKTYFCCAGPEVPFRTHGAGRSEIISAINGLARAARDQCEQLFVYLAGHGFCYPRTESVNEDILVTSDFTSQDDMAAGNHCLKVQELIEVLSIQLGAGTHYYFFDACRTEIPYGEIVPVNLGMSPKRSDLGKAAKAVLFSVEQGLAARTNSRFSEHLINGLNGKGRAKGWIDNELFVKFDFLQKYIETQSKRKLSSQITETDGLILKIDPVPSVACRVRILDAALNDKFVLIIRQRNRDLYRNEFFGPNFVAQIDAPDVYEVRAMKGATPLSQVTPASGMVDLFETAEVVFAVPSGRRGVATRGVIGTSDEGRVTVRASVNAGVRITGAGDEQVFDGTWSSITKDLKPGNYRISLTESGQTVASKEVEVKPGESLFVDPTDNQERTSTHEAILTKIGEQLTGPVSFSESLGAASLDQDLGLWLAYLGASRIVRHDGSFSKLSQVPLQGTFENIRPDQSAVYFLVSLENQSGRCAVGIGDSPEWREMTPVADIPNLYEFSQEIPPGPFRLSFQTPGRTVMTVSSYASANRATLMTLTSSDSKMPIRLYQFMLPIGSLMNRLPEEVLVRIGTEPLQVVRFMTRCQRLFALEHSLAAAFQPTEAESVDSKMYWELIYGKWVDPFGILLAANDLLRRGVLNPKSPLGQYRDVLPVMLKNLRQFFTGIPDIEAIARFLHQPSTAPSAPPLLAESLTAFDVEELPTLLPFATERRIVGSPWVAWANAVQPFFKA